ncbi:MAG: hypothetical protein GY928_01990 [Colwellia sp.]|nr:hypothetical protein [Colwellia sp.]
MAYIIDETYFIRELGIPNLTEVDVSATANPFSYWIDTEARQLLKLALGFELFTDFDSNVVGGVYVPGVTKWDNLVNGVTYTYKGSTYRFQGLVFTEGTVPRSMLANYVWAKWFKFYMSQLTGMGEQYGSAANSFISNGAPREAKVWNDCVQMYNGDINLWEIFSGVEIDDSLFETFQNTYFVSLTKFLLHNETDYPDAAMIYLNYKNRFSI